MADIIRDVFGYLQGIWKERGSVSLERITLGDHWVTEGRACGSVFKLVFTDSKGGWVNTSFVYPNGTMWFLNRGQGRAEIEQAQKEAFDAAAGRDRQVARTAIVKEELIAAAWRPARVARLLECGWDALEEL